jgi:sigma-E factor negative regulatory protein RseB
MPFQLFRHGLRACGLILGLSLGMAHAGALTVSQGAAQPTPSESPSPAQWLRLIGQAARQSSYEGTVMMSSAGRSSSVQVSHRVSGEELFEKIEPLDGPERQIYRHNDDIQILWPHKKTVLVQQRGALLGMPRPWAQLDERVADFYQIDLAGQQRWAGHASTVLLLRARDQFRYGQRVWAEQRSGLVLRAETLAPSGQVLEWTAFTQVNVGPTVARGWTMPYAKSLGGWRVVRSDLKKTTLPQEGWQLNDLPPGFRLLTCVRRGASGMPPSLAASEPAAQASEVVQAVFGDGVTHVSVFIEPFDARRHGREMMLAQGATQTLKRRVGDWWLTVVGDVPAATVVRFAGAFARP